MSPRVSRLLAIALLLVLLCGVQYLAVLPFLAERQAIADGIDSARTQVASYEAILATPEDGGAQPDWDRYAFAGGNSPEGLRARLQETVQRAGLQPTLLDAKLRKPGPQVDEMAATVQGTLDIAALPQLLVALETMQPPLFVETLDLRGSGAAVGARSGLNDVTVILALTGFQRAEGTAP